MSSRSEHDTSSVSRTGSGVIATPRPSAYLYDTGGHTYDKVTRLSVCASAGSDVDDHTQLAKWSTSPIDDQYEHLNDIRKSLGEFSSRGDDIAHFALSTLSTHLTNMTPNLPVITPDPQTRRLAMLAPQADEWRAAEARELESLAKKNVYVVCTLPRGRRLVRTKWVYRMKREGGRVIKWKARLVAMSFTQLAGVDSTETHSSVASSTFIRILIAIVVLLCLEVHHSGRRYSSMEP